METANGRKAAVVAGVLLLTAVVSGMAVYRRASDHPASVLTVGWGGSEGHPSCLYHPKEATVDAKLTIEGKAPRDGRVTVTVTVTAYADENTSVPVGSSSRSVQVAGTVHLPVVLTIPVTKPPHVDEDGESACRLAVKY